MLIFALFLLYDLSSETCPSLAPGMKSTLVPDTK